MNDEYIQGLIYEGVIYLGDDPLYIVEYFDEMGYDANYITLYEVAKPSSGELGEENKQSPRKAFETVERNFRLPTETPLSKEAFSKLKPKKITREVDKPPIYMTVVEQGKDTFTGNTGLGFYEQAPAKFVNNSGHVILEKGQRTGVFIGLDSISWRKRYMPTDKMVNQYLANRELWGLL